MRSTRAPGSRRRAAAAALAAVAAAALGGCGGHPARPADGAPTTTARLFAGTGLAYPKHLHRPPTENN